MKKIFLSILIGTLLVCNNIGCKKDNDELSKLPPPTQEGRNTFGCLINGKAWVPVQTCAPFVCDPVLEMHYDTTEGGRIIVGANVQTPISEHINIYTDSFHFRTEFNVESRGQTRTGASYFGNNTLPTGCTWISAADTANVKCTGNLVVTKYDVASRVFAGNFEFTLIKTGCDTVRITHGRFDIKL